MISWNRKEGQMFKSVIPEPVKQLLGVLPSSVYQCFLHPIPEYRSHLIYRANKIIPSELKSMFLHKEFV